MDTQPTREQVVSQIGYFLDALTKLHKEHFAVNFSVLTPPTFEAQIAQKYARIVRKERGDKSGSVYCFIDMSNGDIRKAAGWKAPAPHKRGSIFNENCDVGENKPASVFGSGLYLR